MESDFEYGLLDVGDTSQMDQMETRKDGKDPARFKIYDPDRITQPKYLMQENQAIPMISIYDTQHKDSHSLTLAFKTKQFIVDKKVLRVLRHTNENPSVFQKSHQVELGALNIEQKSVYSKSSIYKKLSTTEIRTECDENVMCNICLWIFDRQTCIEKFRDKPFNDLYISNRFNNRKLLQINKAERKKDKERAISPRGISEQISVSKIIDSQSSDLNESSASKRRMKELSQLIEELKQDISKEPVWAMISVTFLMLFLVFVGKLCGMRVIKQGRDINVDIDEDFHNVSVLEVVRVKKRYLPQGLFGLRNKLYRKFRKKPRKVKEKDISEPLTEDSEEERLIYDRLSPV